MEMASKARHPRHIVDGVPKDLRDLLENLPAPKLRAMEMTAALREWVSRARELEAANSEVFAAMPDHCKRVLKGKRLSLFKAMLEKSAYSDLSIVEDMAAGFDLAGKVAPSPNFKKRRSTAGITVADLERTALVVRKGILRLAKSSGDDALDRAVLEATRLELERGWLWGPVDVASLPNTACVSRRFGIWQGSKCRPIDNLLESGLNSTTHAEDTIVIHTADCVAAGLALRLRHDASVGAGNPLLMKVSDLKKAYKQLPVSAASLNHNYIAVYNPEIGAAQVFGQVVLPFGSRQSVHGFCRAALAVWAVATRLFKVHWSVYFDDYVVVETKEMAQLCNLCVSTYFRLLGWTVSEDKDAPFSNVAKVLGLEINLKECHLGFVLLQNTEKRRQELEQTLDAHLKSRKLSPKEGAKLRGRLIFAECQIFGRQAGVSMRALSAHVLSGRSLVTDDLARALHSLKQHIVHGPPRRVSASIVDTLHLYVDAAFEPDNRSYPGGLGGVLVEVGLGPIAYFSLQLSAGEVHRVHKSKSQNPIFELECLAILGGLHTWRDDLAAKHVVVFTDNNGALSALIKGGSKNEAGFNILTACNRVLDAIGAVAWFERVNTASNVADEPSRHPECSGLGVKRQLNLSELLAITSDDSVGGGWHQRHVP